MKDLHEILQEKENAIKRLEREVEAIRVVLGILDDETVETAAKKDIKPQPITAPMAERTYQPLERTYPTAIPSTLPTMPDPLRYNAAQTAAPAELPVVEPRKTSTRNWP